jgi:hypothetical protein
LYIWPFLLEMYIFSTSLHEAKMLTNWFLINLSTHKYKLFLVFDTADKWKFWLANYFYKIWDRY